ncbi:hypothetical protein [Faecalibaculum rodentium]|uniref:hypothetical protein n=1 Tax=Faecalibaculum rodentium TaxID=1702221 RepID=UPI0023F23A4E|nr:hypothetical protein [Faecalibaculum rodentium]
MKPWRHRRKAFLCVTLRLVPAGFVSIQALSATIGMRTCSGIIGGGKACAARRNLLV